MSNSVKKDSIRLLLADDQVMLMAGLAALINTISGLEVVGQVSEMDEILDEYKRLTPDVLLCDIMFDSQTTGAKTGLDVLQEVLAYDSDAHVVMYSQFESATNMQGAYKLGAKAFLTKNASPEDIEAAIRKAASNNTFFASNVAQTLASISINGVDDEASPLDALTERELEIFILMAKGDTQEEISKKSGLHHRTITNEIKKIKEKTGVKKSALITLLAVKHKLIDIDAVMNMSSRDTDS